ncbi:MAG: CCA tRNA nucleotidyltransferase [Candidatus Limnocylindrus sp.]|nr:MAG: CCA tRNA nucleotidyltransferase [Candidatus Limnocylindrus sp.]
MSHEAALRAAVPEDVAELMGQLRAARFAAYVVGGAVRDTLAGRAPSDWDLATDATPDQLRNAFPDAQYENRFGTVGIPTSAGVREVTTFRADGPSSDARRPDVITFLSAIEGDLARRDFTINAMAFGAPSGAHGDLVASGSLIDPFGGAADLAAGLLRAVGDPSERFREDALRMLRAARFATRFNLTIEPATAAAIRRDVALVATLSGERIGAEVEGILAAENPAPGLHTLNDLGLTAQIAPELHAAWVTELPARVAAVGRAGSPDAPDPIGRLAELLAVITDDAVVEKILTAWRRPRATLHAVAALRAADRSAAAAERGEIDAAAYRIATAAQSGDPRDAARQLRRRIASGRATPAAATLLVLCERADEQQIPALVGDLAADGGEIIAAINEQPGAWVKPLLEELLQEVAHGRVANRRDAIVAAAKQLYEKKR